MKHFLIRCLPLALFFTPAFAIDYSAWVTNSTDGTVSVIDTNSEMVIETIGVGTNPVALAITPSGMYMYVVNQGSDNVSVIDTLSSTVIATTMVGTSPDAIAITPDGLYALVVNNGSGNVSVIDTTTQMVIMTIPVGTSPDAIAINPVTIAGDYYAYVTNNGSGNVSVINASTQTFLTNITVGTNPDSVVITPDGLLVLVTNNGSGNVTVFLANTPYTVGPTLTVGTNPTGATITPVLVGGTYYVLVANTGSNSISIINFDTYTVDTFTDPGVIVNPVAFAINSIGTFAYVANDFNSSSNMGYGFAVPSHLVSVVYATGPNSTAIAITPDDSFVYQNDSTPFVTIFDTSLEAASPLMVGNGPSAIVFGPMIIPPPPPPPSSPVSGFFGKKHKNNFIITSELFNCLRWDPYPGALSYQLFRNGKLIATLSGSATCFEDHDQPNKKTTYTLIAETLGGPSPPITIIVNPI